MKDVKKFTVGDYITITKDCQEVTKAVMLLDSKDKEEQANAFGQLIATALPQVVQVIVVATNSTKEEIEKIDDISEILDYLFTIVEVNNFLALKKRVADKFKALKA